MRIADEVSHAAISLPFSWSRKKEESGMPVE